jgi:hypothetical protein
MGKKIGIIIGVIVLCGAVGAGAFYGGTLYEQQQLQNVRNTFFNGRGGAGGNGANGGGGGGGAGGAGGGVFGTVKSISGNTIQLSTPQNVATVNLTGTTVVQKTVAGTTTDIHVGDIITVRGQRDPAGNVTATTVQVLPPGTTLPNRGGGNGGGGNGGNNNGGGGATTTPQD